jgi:hypothetical protein
MNPTKWKSVVVSRDAYAMIKSLATANHRTISGQFTHILETYIQNQPLGESRGTTAAE